jgi:predicted peroxiredoxin
MGIVRAAKERNHDVVIFFNEESVKLLVQYPELNECGVDMFACHTTCQNVGILEKDLTSGAKMSSLAEMVVLIEENDRTLFLG